MPSNKEKRRQQQQRRRLRVREAHAGLAECAAAGHTCAMTSENDGRGSFDVEGAASTKAGNGVVVFGPPLPPLPPLPAPLPPGAGVHAAAARLQLVQKRRRVQKQRQEATRGKRQRPSRAAARRAWEATCLAASDEGLAC